VWDRCIARGGITLLSALWKAGKTTMLAHLLKGMQGGGNFCGLAVAGGRALYVTEESEGQWAERRDELGLTDADNVWFQVRPFMVKPRPGEWKDLIDHLAGLQHRRPADLIVFDTLSNLWPVKDENDAGQVGASLMPLHRLTDKAGVLLVHHLRKGDGQEATGARGSGALPAFVDCILELRRFAASKRGDRRRVLTGYGRWEGTPEEVVIELAADGTGYIAHGDKQQVAGKELRAAILGVLPTDPGKALDTDDILEGLPESAAVRRQTLLSELRRGAEANPPDWRREGKGAKGSPYTYWVDPPG
jgi:hypothetical protein